MDPINNYHECVITLKNGEKYYCTLQELLFYALVSNRHDWLTQMKCTITEAVRFIGPEWAELIPVAADEINRDLPAYEVSYLEVLHDPRS